MLVVYIFESPSLRTLFSGKVIPSPLMCNLIYLKTSVKHFVFVCSILEQLQRSSLLSH
ncbi:unknown [Salmonella phage FelixO1]|uniref:Uncharacterized protein n=1 Tax=Salmonella phage Felix O1 (isolate Felix O1-VT1) TaxID=1283336 RepID=Q6KGR7_BPFO1|nr:unknown [Salmonella phage FelixO1]